MTSNGTTSKPIIYKVVFMGETGVGKSSLAVRIANDTFLAYSDATIGASYFCKVIEKYNKTYKFNIWDTAGQEKYSCLVPLYYRNCDVAFVVYDITNKSSYNKAIANINELRGNSDVEVIVLIGNKSDMFKERMITPNEASTFCRENNMIFMETSAKLGINVKELLDTIIKEMPQPTKSDKVELPILPISNKYNMWCCS